MIRHFFLAALLAVPAAAFAQQTAPAPVPQVSAEAPGAAAVAAPQLDTSAPALSSPAPSAGQATAPVAVSPAVADAATGTAAVQPDATAPAAAADSAVEDTAADSPVEDTAAPAELLPPAEPLAGEEELMAMAEDAAAEASKFLQDGGPSIWAIAALSVITLALILWKIWRLALIGAWSRGKAGQAVEAFEQGSSAAALTIVKGRRGVRSKVISAALEAIQSLPEERAREETARVAKREIASARVGLGALELISTIAPLLGLLGTVLGMIAAFQALQAAGSKADPALLAGGIWEALLTTAAGMAVAIPASAALTWFEAVIERIRRDVEDGATRLFVAHEPAQLQMAAE